MLFTDLALRHEVMQAIAACNFQKPTPIQEKIIPYILEGKDVVASSQTGTGKTAAYVLPILDRLAGDRFKPNKKVKVLVLCPTRELAQQIYNSWKTFGKYLNYNITTLVGGVSYDPQIKALQKGLDVIVATPGRLLDHLKRKRVDLSQVSYFVLDEADRMLDMGFRDDVLYVAKMLSKKHQTMLFSATIDNQLKNIINELMHKPSVINLSQEKITAPKITQEILQIKRQKDKPETLMKILRDQCIYKALIFSSTKRNAKNLAQVLSSEGFKVASLHGDLKQNARNRTLSQLKTGKIQFVVATDVLARGIDVQDISHVINYDLPHSVEDYVHRIGRTARAEKTGIAISFMLPGDEKKIAYIEKYIGERLVVKNADGEICVVTNSTPKKDKHTSSKRTSSKRTSRNNQTNETGKKHKRRKKHYARSHKPDNDRVINKPSKKNHQKNPGVRISF